MPFEPSASKKALCGFTPTACGATASMIPLQKRGTSSRSSTGIRSGRGSRPTTSWLRFCSTADASRSAKFSATALNLERGPVARPSYVHVDRSDPVRNLLVRLLDSLLELAAGREFRHPRRGDVHALARIPRVDSLPRGPVLRGELPEAGEGHLFTSSQ